MKSKMITVFVCLIGFFVFFNTCYSFTKKELKELCVKASTEAYCKSTAKKEPTKPSEVIAKVTKACKLVSKEGEKAFPKFYGKSPFIFDGSYIWIHRVKDSVMLMHPIKCGFVGKNLMGLKDKKGKRIFPAFNRTAKKGGGWVQYAWPKPGTKDTVNKISYVKLCTFPNGEQVVLGCGLYNYDPEDIKKLKLN